MWLLKNKLYNGRRQHLENLGKSVSQYFPYDWRMMLHNCVWVKDPFRIQDRPGDFNGQSRKIHSYRFRVHIAAFK